MPGNMKALYRRGLARKGKGDLKGARRGEFLEREGGPGRC
jgi:hypothetical protein